MVGYTSGTTSRPKGAMLSHRAFAYTLAHRAAWQADRPEETELLVLPVSHLAGMRVMNQAVRLGRTLVLLARWDAEAAVELIERRRVYAWPAVTTMLAEVMARPDIGRRDLSSLRRIYGGASAMPEALAREIHLRLGIPYLESYGMTEFCGLALSNPPQAARRQCAGVPVINCDVRVIDPESGAELGVNAPGEIVMHGPSLFDGYWANPEATAAALIDLDGKRFLRSGDIGYHDEDGYFYVTDRLKRMINASGLKVWPAEVEAALFGHPAVQEACVISARDPHRGETVKAVVVLRPGAAGTVRPEDLTEWARTRMAPYKVPRLVEFVRALPKTSTGKTLWRELQAMQDERDRGALTR
ncbi:AMP-binding protein [Cupriavidus necator]|uniref:AMP-binding protein n=1 Tax=Cupriavidus necator TaxID=106590 RepID=UPI001926FAF0|nr:AMP-binding protein [Cupriavidus necator]QQX82780.1 AMP-binding protein [Cupriavidus necator]